MSRKFNKESVTLMPLNKLAIGKTALIEQVSCESAAIVRLLEMGMLPGTEVKLVRRTPLGGPLQITLRGGQLCLREKEAAQFWVQAV